MRYPCISPPKNASATPTAPPIHMKRSARWRRVHPAGRRRKWRTVSASLLRCCFGAGPAPPGGAPTWHLRPGVVWVACANFLWGVRGFPPRGDCAASGRWAARPCVVYVAAPGQVPVGVWAGGPRWAAAACRSSARWALRSTRLRLCGGSSRSTWGGRAWGAVLGSQSGRRPASGAS